MGHPLTVPSAPNWRSINTGKWESRQSKERCGLRCSSRCECKAVACVRAHGSAQIFSPGGWAMSLSAYYFSVYCLTTLWKGFSFFFFLESCTAFVIDQVSVVQRVNLCLAFGCSALGANKDQKPDIGQLTAPEGPWEWSWNRNIAYYIHVHTPFLLLSYAHEQTPRTPVLICLALSF